MQLCNIFFFFSSFPIPVLPCAARARSSPSPHPRPPPPAFADHLTRRRGPNPKPVQPRLGRYLLASRPISSPDAGPSGGARDGCQRPAVARAEAVEGSTSGIRSPSYEPRGLWCCSSSSSSAKSSRRRRRRKREAKGWTTSTAAAGAGIRQAPARATTGAPRRCPRR